MIAITRQPLATKFFCVLIFQKTSAKSSADVAKNSSIAHAAAGSASHGGSTHPSTGEIRRESFRHKSTALHAASSRPPPAATLVATATSSCESLQLPASCDWNSSPAATSLSTAFVSSKNGSELDDRCSYTKGAANAVVSASSGDCELVTGSTESCDRSQTTDTEEQHEKDVLTTVGCGAFRTVKATNQVPITDAAEVNQCHSSANPEENLPLNSPTRSVPSDDISATSLSPSITGQTDKQLHDVEPDDNTLLPAQAERLADDQRPLQETDNPDVSARLNSDVNCCQEQPTSDVTSDDLFDVCQLEMDDDVSDDDRVARLQQMCLAAALSAAEAAALDEARSKIVSTLNNESCMPTGASELDSVHQYQQMNQSLTDQRQTGSQTSDTKFQRQEPGDVLEELFSSCNINKIFPDEHTFAVSYDNEIPEIPLFQNYANSHERGSVNQKLAHDDRGCEISVETMTGPPDAETEELKGTVCNEADDEPVWVQASVTENTACQASSAQCQVDEQKDANVDVCGLSDSEQATDAVRPGQSSCRPLDLTCSRVHSTSDAQRPGKLLNSADVVGSAGRGCMNCGNCAPTNMCNYQTPHAGLYESCTGWSMVRATNSYSVGWLPYPPHPCCGFPGVFPGPRPPIFPGLQCPCHGTQTFEAGSRGRGTRPRRRRRVPSSCSRVDGIRSTKVSSDGEPSQMRDASPCISESFVSATGAPRQTACSSSGEVSTHPTPTSSADTVVSDQITTDDIDVSTIYGKDSDLPAPGDVNILDLPSQIDVDNLDLPAPDDINITDLLSPEDVNNLDLPAPSDVNNPPPVVASSETEARKVRVASRSRSGRGRGRTPKNSAATQPPSSVGQQDSTSQPVKRKRGRPRKHPPRDASSVDATTAPTHIGRPPRSRRKRSSTASSSPVWTSQAAEDAGQRCPTVVERTETCENLDVGSPGTSTPPVNASSGTTLSQRGSHCVGDNGSGTASTTLPADSTTAAALTAEQRSSPMPPSSKSPAGRVLRGPIATSGAIIKKPRSRKQRCRVPSGTTAEANTTRTDESGKSSVSPDGKQPVSWQPLVTESAISSLLDTLSVASSEHEMPEPTLTSCDIRLQTSTSTPFVALERADLNRCAFRHVHI